MSNVKNISTSPVLVVKHVDFGLGQYSVHRLSLLLNSCVSFVLSFRKPQSSSSSWWGNIFVIRLSVNFSNLCYTGSTVLSTEFCSELVFYIQIICSSHTIC